MIYSVWNNAKGQYDYFEDKNSKDNYKPFSTREIGLAPNEAARVVPSTAVGIGAGKQAKGTIAIISRSVTLGDIAADINWTVLGGLALVAYGLWKYVR